MCNISLRPSGDESPATRGLAGGTINHFLTGVGMNRRRASVGIFPVRHFLRGSGDESKPSFAAYLFLGLIPPWAGDESVKQTTV